MKLKVKRTSTTSFSSDKIILMCNYKENGVSKKFLLDVAVGSSFEVADHIGAALLGAENLQSVLSVDVGGHETKMATPNMKKAVAEL